MCPRFRVGGGWACDVGFLVFVARNFSLSPFCLWLWVFSLSFYGLGPPCGCSCSFGFSRLTCSRGRDPCGLLGFFFFPVFFRFLLYYTFGLLFVFFFSFVLCPVS